MAEERARVRRLFLGLVLPPAVGERLDERVRPSLAAARGLTTYPPRDLHLTLAFLGPFPEERRPGLERDLAVELAGLAAPALRLTGTGVFPDRRRPRVLWAGLEERGPTGRLAAVRNRVWQAALEHGWRPPRREFARPFHPHVTLARVRRPPRGLEPFLALTFALAWGPEEVTLLESRPDRPEERYRPLARVPLALDPGAE